MSRGSETGGTEPKPPDFPEDSDGSRRCIATIEGGDGVNRADHQSAPPVARSSTAADGGDPELHGLCAAAGWVDSRIARRAGKRPRTAR